MALLRPRAPLVWLAAVVCVVFASLARAQELPSPLAAPLDEAPNPRAPLREAIPPVYEIDASLSADGARLQGVARISFENTSHEALSFVPVMLYPNRFTKRPDYLSELNQPAHYPGAFSPGEMRVSQVLVRGFEVQPSEYLPGPEAEKLFAKIPLEPALLPGERVTLELRYEVDIPERFGRFGRAERAVVLDGGFYPALAALAPGGFELGRFPIPGVFSASLRAEGDVFSSFVNGAGPVLPGQVAEVQKLSAPYLSWILLDAPRLRSGADIAAPREDGLETPPDQPISYFYTDTLRQDRAGDAWENGTAGLDDDSSRDYPAEIVAATKEALDFLTALGFDTHDLSICLVEIPMREHLFRVAPGVILVSDRAMKIFPTDKLLKFHKLQLARALYSSIVERRARGFEREEDLPWVADAVGAYLTDLFHLKEYIKPEFAKEMLKPFSFISEIDRLRWVPQVGFKDAYFRSAFEGDAFRDDVRRYPRRTPYGKFVYGKLRAVLGVDHFAAFARDYLGGAQTPFRELSARYYGKPLEWFYAQWLGPHPQLNYKLVSFESQLQPDGSYLHTIKVTKEGDTFVREPVEVLAIEKGGQQTSLTWPLDAVEHTFSLRGESPLSRVRIDPNEETYERIRGIPTDLRFDNQSPSTWRVVFDGFTADASSNGVSFATSGSARRTHDSRNFYFLGLSGASGLLGGFDGGQAVRLDDFEAVTLGYRYGFGLGLDADRLTMGLTGSAFGARLGPRVLDLNSDGSADSVTPPALLGRVTASLGYSDRLSFLYPWKGTSIGTSLSYSVGAPQSIGSLSLNGTPLEVVDSCGGGLCHALTLVTNASRLFSLDGGRVFGARINAAFLFGTPLGQALIDLGGNSGLKGYPLNVVEGRGRVYGSLEYRHPLWTGRDVNIAEVNRLRSVTGVVWADGATISGGSSIVGDPVRSLFGAQSFFADVGVGLRLIGDHLGIDPAMLSLDLALPLVDSQLTGGRLPPAQFFVGFDHNF